MSARILSGQEVALAADLAQVVYRNSIEPFFNHPQMDRVFYEYADRNRLVERAEAGQVVVWGAFMGNNLYAMAAMQPEGHITMLYVLQQFQKRGTGKALLKEIKKYAFDKYHYAAVTLNAMPPWTADYFRHCGFTSINNQADLRSFVAMQSKIGTVPDYDIRPVKTGVVMGISMAALAVCVVIAIVYGITGIL